ncbi:MAG: hypothetical protein KDD47_06985, partial [Acidobacteria bacterium]|nr:hypothetical protein [Acidobacteriota bacterium]
MKETFSEDRAELARALAGDRKALDHLVGRLLPVVHARVARTLLRYHGGREADDLRQVVEDSIQEVFLRLF